MTAGVALAAILWYWMGVSIVIGLAPADPRWTGPLHQHSLWLVAGLLLLIWAWPAILAYVLWPVRRTRRAAGKCCGAYYGG